MNTISIFRTTFSKQLICAVLIFHFVNFSIDTYDYTGPLSKNFPVNEIESVIEFMCEEVLQMGNIFAESDDEDKTTVELILKFILSPAIDLPRFEYRPVKTLMYYTSPVFHSLSAKINTPPPK